MPRGGCAACSERPDSSTSMPPSAEPPSTLATGRSTGAPRPRRVRARSAPIGLDPPRGRSRSAWPGVRIGLLARFPRARRPGRPAPAVGSRAMRVPRRRAGASSPGAPVDDRPARRQSRASRPCTWHSGATLDDRRAAAPRASAPRPGRGCDQGDGSVAAIPDCGSSGHGDRGRCRLRGDTTPEPVPNGGVAPASVTAALETDGETALARPGAAGSPGRANPASALTRAAGSRPGRRTGAARALPARARPPLRR